MTTWWRRLRAALGVGAAWGTVWLAAGLALLVVVGPNAADVPFPLFFGFLGFLAGVVFSLILWVRGSKQKLEEMSFARFGGWGAAGGLLLSLALSLVMALSDGAAAFANLAILAPVFAGAGAVCAAGSLALARRAAGPTLRESAVELVDGQRAGDARLHHGNER